MEHFKHIQELLSHGVSTNVVLQHTDRFSFMWDCTILHPHKQHIECLFPHKGIKRVYYQSFGEKCCISGVFIFIIMNKV